MGTKEFVPNGWMASLFLIEETDKKVNQILGHSYSADWDLGQPKNNLPIANHVNDMKAGTYESDIRPIHVHGGRLIYFISWHARRSRCSARHNGVKSFMKKYIKYGNLEISEFLFCQF